ncbi:MAG: hypothetical protein MK066_05865 [Crocinitomicaceae bacterium]|nr:hypothetical protein [Crocinitomicaceae bacterium]
MKSLLLLTICYFTLPSFGQTGIISAKSKSILPTCSTVDDDNFGLPEPRLDSIIYIGDHCIIEVLRSYNRSKHYHDTICNPYIFEENNYDLKTIKQMFSNNVIFVGFEKLKTEKIIRKKSKQNSPGWISILLIGSIIFLRQKVNTKLPIITTFLLIGIGNQVSAQTGIIAIKSQGRDITTINKSDDTFGGPEIIFPISKVIRIRYLGNCSIEMTRQIKTSQSEEKEACTLQISTDTISNITNMHSDDFSLEKFQKNFDKDVIFEDFKQLTKERKKINRNAKKSSKKTKGVEGLILLLGISTFLISFKQKSTIA